MKQIGNAVHHECRLPSMPCRESRARLKTAGWANLCKVQNVAAADSSCRIDRPIVQQVRDANTSSSPSRLLGFMVRPVSHDGSRIRHGCGPAVAPFDPGQTGHRGSSAVSRSILDYRHTNFDFVPTRARSCAAIWRNERTADHAVGRHRVTDIIMARMTPPSFHANFRRKSKQLPFPKQQAQPTNEDWYPNRANRMLLGQMPATNNGSVIDRLSQGE